MYIERAHKNVLLICILGLYLIYELEKITDQLFQAKLSPCSQSGILEFQTVLHYPLRLQNSSLKKPLSLRIPRCRLWYGMNIFWNHPIVWDHITGVGISESP